MKRNIAEIIRESQPPVFRISREIGMLIDSNEECVIDTLKEHGLYRDDLVYRGANVSNWKGILTNGTDRSDANYDYVERDYAEPNLELIRQGHKHGDFFYGSLESHLGREHGTTGDPINYALNHGDEIPVLIVYDPDKVVDKSGELSQPDLYFFKDGKKKDAIVALFVWE